MAEREISVVMQSTYKGDLVKRLRQDQRRLAAFQRMLDRKPLNVPVKLDLRGAMTQAQALRKAILGEFARMPSTILGADGRPATGPTSGKKTMNPRAGVLSTTESLRFDKDGKQIEKQTQQVEQLGRGLQQVNKFKDDASSPFATITKDTSNVEDLRQSLRGMNEELRKTYAQARGRGDKPMQIQALQEQKARLDAALQSAAAKGLNHSPLYSKGEDQIAGLNDKIAALEGRQESADTKKSRQDRTREVRNQITEEQRRVQELLKANKLEADAAERITDKAAREKEINRVYDERKKLFQQSQKHFQDMDASLQKEGRPDLADSAMRGGLGMNNQANQADLDKQRAETDRLRKDRQEQDRLAKKAAADQAKAQRVADQAAKRSNNLNFGRAMRLDDHATKTALRHNEAQEAAAKAIPDRTAREAELNRVLAERVKIHQDSARRMGVMQANAQAANNPEQAAKAEAAALKSQDAAAKVGVSQTKANSDAQQAAHREAEAAKKQAATQAKAAADSAFNREMQDIKARSEKRIAAINSAERKEKAAAKNAKEKVAAAHKAHSLRQTEYQNRATSYDGVESRARSAGRSSVADNARGKRLGAEVAAAKDIDRFTAATNRSGHALNFHSSSLLRNAVTFLRWQTSMLAVTKTVQAFTSGFSSAMAVNRQFATLRSVFRGTDEEAQRLKEDTLDLAAAQGRAGSEAMDASIRWSRLGLNRIQVIEATRTSLIAANVAEISAAEAAEKLSAIYATYRLNVGDLPVVLSRLNAISNRYNVTNKDLLEGIVRVAGVAKQSGFALRDLEGIIGAVTGATGRPGQEVGNALKFVVTRLGSPEVMAQLKKNFDIDLTAPNGDLKDMSQIFRELASIYPTLNKAQQQLFLKFTAGSRQASRFALVLDQYRQSQILAAEAGFDASSAFQENQKILESLQSRIDSLKASWTDLFTVMGDSGVFDFLAKRVRGLQDAIDTLARHKAGKGDKKEFTINDPGQAETIENIGGGWDTIAGTRSDFDEAEIMRTILTINAAIKERKKLIEENANDMGNVPLSEKSGMGGGAAFKGAGDKISDATLHVSNPNNFLKFEQFDGVEHARKTVESLMALLNDGGDTGATDQISAMTSGVNALRERLGSLERAANVFESMGESLKSNTIDREAMVRDFESGAHLLLNLEDGANKYGDAIDRFYKLLDSKDNAGLGNLMEEIRGMFAADAEITGKSFGESVQPAVDNLRAKRLALEAEKRKAMQEPDDGTADGRKDKAAKIEQIQGNIKATQAAIEQLTQAVEAFNKAAYGPQQVANISQYLDDVMAQASAFGDAIKDLTPDIEGDPVERIFARRRKSLNLGLDYLKETRDRTTIKSEVTKHGAKDTIRRAENTIGENENSIEYLKQGKRKNADRRRELQDKIDYNQRILPNWERLQTESGNGEKGREDAKDAVKEIKEQNARYQAELDAPDTAIAAKHAEIEAAKKLIEEQKKLIDQQDAADQMVQTRITAEEARLEQLQRELDIQEQISNVVRTQSDASRKAGNSSLAWRFGEEESDKDRNQASAAIARANAMLDGSGNISADNPKAKASLSGSVLQDEATARANLETLERRQYELDAARKQVAIDTAKAMREQTEEASKRLMLASREDQLRAAALARTLRDKGPVKDREFFALSQESRQAFTNFLPNQAPDSLNEAKSSAAKAARDIAAEQTRISSTIGNLRGSLDELAKRINAASGKGGPLDIAPPSPGGTPQDVAGPRDGSPIVNVNLGDVAVTVELHKSVERMLTGYVDRVLKAGLTAMEQRLTRPPVPNSMGVTE